MNKKVETLDEQLQLLEKEITQLESELEQLRKKRKNLLLERGDMASLERMALSDCEKDRILIAGCKYISRINPTYLEELIGDTDAVRMALASNDAVQKSVLEFLAMDSVDDIAKAAENTLWRKNS